MTNKEFKTCMNRDEQGGLDIYETPPEKIDDLLLYENYPKEGIYYEPCNGINHYIQNKLNSLGYCCNGSDILVGDDFLKYDKKVDYIITNPPFNLSKQFCEKCFECVNKKFSFLVPLNWLDCIIRYEIFHNKDFLPKSCLVYSKRFSFVKGGGLPTKNITGMSFCWITFEKGWDKNCELKWIKPPIKEKK